MPDKIINLKVKSADPSLPAAFSNFIAISRVATEVQFEFIFVDINEVANTLQKPQDSGEPSVLSGRTVAKVVVPALSVVQLRDHIAKLMEAIEKDFGEMASKLAGESEETDASSTRMSG